MAEFKAHLCISDAAHSGLSLPRGPQLALAWFVLSYISMPILYAPTWPTFSALSQLSLTASGMRDQKPVCAKYALGDTVSGNPWSNDWVALCIPRMRNNQHEI